MLDFILSLDQHGFNPLHLIAASSITGENTKLILDVVLPRIPQEKITQYINQPDQIAGSNMTQICHAFGKGGIGFGKYLLSKGVALPSDEQIGSLLICIAANTGDMELMQICLKSERSIYTVFAANGFNSLHFAALRGNVAMCRFILDEDARLLQQKQKLAAESTQEVSHSSVAAASMPISVSQELLLLDRPSLDGTTARQIIVSSDSLDLRSILEKAKPITVQHMAHIEQEDAELAAALAASLQTEEVDQQKNTVTGDCKLPI